MTWRPGALRAAHCTRANGLYLMLAPLFAATVALGIAVLRGGVHGDVTRLTEALRMKEIAVESRALLLVQDDATKTLILRPDDSIAGPRKITAYDANVELLRSAAMMGRGSELEGIVRSVQKLDDMELSAIDTQILETLGSGETGRAWSLYETRYEPARERYEALLLLLGAVAERRAGLVSNDLEAKSRRRRMTICCAFGMGFFLIAALTVLLARQMSLQPRSDSGRRAVFVHSAGSSS